MKNPELSIVVPVYNERSRLEAGLSAILSFIEQADYPIELLVVDDGSTDGTDQRAAEMLKDRPEAELISLSVNQGKGAAVKTGMLSAHGEVRLFTDVDLSVPIDVANEFCRLCREGSDIVIGTRKVQASQVEIHQPRYREILGEVFRQFTLRAFTPGLSDITCGFKAFSAETAERIFSISVTKRWSFDAEILFLALQYGLEVTEMPVVWRNDPETKVRLAVDLPRSLWELLNIRLRWARGGYPRS